MRIAYDAKRLFNNFTGLGNYSRSVLKSIIEYYPDNDLLLYTPKVQNTPETRLFLQSPQCLTQKPASIIKGSLWRTMFLPNEVKADKADIFHGLSNEIPVGLKKRGIPSVVTIHDVAFKTFKDMYHWHDRQIYTLKFNYACTHADKIVAISENTKADILKFCPNVDESKIHVIYQPVQDIFYVPMEKETARKIASEAIPALPESFLLYVGSINSRKNLMAVVKALECMPESERLPLVIVGRGKSYKTKVQNYVAENNLNKYCIWVDYLSDNVALQALYTCASIFIYPSFYEGFGLPVVEAMLSRCPVVTSNVSSLPEAGGDGAALIDPKNHLQLADTMLNILRNDNIRKQMTEKGFEYATTKFNPHSLATEMINLYKSML